MSVRIEEVARQMLQAVSGQTHIVVLRRHPAFGETDLVPRPADQVGADQGRNVGGAGRGKRWMEHMGLASVHGDSGF